MTYFAGKWFKSCLEGSIPVCTLCIKVNSQQHYYYMNHKLLVGIVSATLASGSLAMAVNPSTTFGPLNAANFGGSGNPNQAVQVTTWTSPIAGDTITLGLAAQQRYDNPALGNDGAGTYFATPGSNVKGPSSILGSLWNFDYYINVSSSDIGRYHFKLLYDFNPGANTPDNQLGVIDINAALAALQIDAASIKTVQDSENLLFPFLSTSGNGITPPPGTFDPNATGEYTFKLEVVNADGNIQAESDIKVDVQGVPDTNSTALLLSLATGGLLVFASKRTKRQTA